MDFTHLSTHRSFPDLSLTLSWFCGMAVSGSKNHHIAQLLSTGQYHLVIRYDSITVKHMLADDNSHETNKYPSYCCPVFPPSRFFLQYCEGWSSEELFWIVSYYLHQFRSMVQPSSCSELCKCSPLTLSDSDLDGNSNMISVAFEHLLPLYPALLNALPPGVPGLVRCNSPRRHQVTFPCRHCLCHDALS